MLNWHDWAVYCANNKRYETLKIRQQKCTTSEDLVEKEQIAPSFPCALTITDLEIPQFTSLDIKGLLDIGVFLKKIY